LQLDRALLERSAAYQKLRDSGQMGEVQLQLVHPKTFVQMKDILNEINYTTSDQYKVPRITTNMDAIELLMKRTM
jgi:hypothetical protein